MSRSESSGPSIFSRRVHVVGLYALWTGAVLEDRRQDGHTFKRIEPSLSLGIFEAERYSIKNSSNHCLSQHGYRAALCTNSRNRSDFHSHGQVIPEYDWNEEKF